MKYLVFLPFAMLLGLVIGSWAPKEELRTLKREMQKLQTQVASNEKDSRMDAFTRMMRIPDRARTTTNVAANAINKSANAEDQKRQANDTANTMATNNVTLANKKQRNAPSPEDLRARIDEAKELWKTRVEIARSQWQNRLKLDTEQATQFDNAINDMNEKLYYAAQDFANKLDNTTALTPEEATRALNDMTGILTETYNDFQAVVPEEQRGEISMIELTDFIDPGVAEPLIPVQAKLENAAPQRRRNLGNTK